LEKKPLPIFNISLSFFEDIGEGDQRNESWLGSSGKMVPAKIQASRDMARLKPGQVSQGFTALPSLHVFEIPWILS